MLFIMLSVHYCSIILKMKNDRSIAHFVSMAVVIENSIKLVAENGD